MLTSPRVRNAIGMRRSVLSGTVRGVRREGGERLGLVVVHPEDPGERQHLQHAAQLAGRTEEQDVPAHLGRPLLAGDQVAEAGAVERQLADVEDELPLPLIEQPADGVAEVSRGAAASVETRIRAAPLGRGRPLDLDDADVSLAPDRNRHAALSEEGSMCQSLAQNPPFRLAARRVPETRIMRPWPAPSSRKTASPATASSAP